MTRGTDSNQEASLATPWNLASNSECSYVRLKSLASDAACSPVPLTSLASDAACSAVPLTSLTFDAAPHMLSHMRKVPCPGSRRRSLDDDRNVFTQRYGAEHKVSQRPFFKEIKSVPASVPLAGEPSRGSSGP